MFSKNTSHKRRKVSVPMIAESDGTALNTTDENSIVSEFSDIKIEAISPTIMPVISSTILPMIPIGIDDFAKLRKTISRGGRTHGYH